MRIHPHSMLLQELAENLSGEYRKMFAHALRCADCQEGLLQLLAAQPFGRVLLGVVALGFVALGLHSFACARWIRTLE